MGTGSNVGSFFGGFGEAFGQNLLGYEKEKRAKKQQREMIAIDVWRNTLLDKEADDDQRQVAANELARLTGNPGLKNIAGLVSQIARSSQQSEVLPQDPSQLQLEPLVPELPQRPPSLGSAASSAIALGGPSPLSLSSAVPLGPQAAPAGPSSAVPLGGMGQAVQREAQRQLRGIFPSSQLPDYRAQSPIFPSVTKSRPGQAPTRLITAMPQRPAALATSQAERMRQAQFERQQQLESFRTDENIRQAEAVDEIRRKAQAGELGQLVPGFVDAGNGEAAVVYVNPINSERTVIRLGKPLNEFRQQLEALSEAGIRLSPEEVKRVVFKLNPSAAEAEALQQAKDWVDSKNPDPNISGPAKLRLQEKRADLGYKHMATANLGSQMQNRGQSEKQLQSQALKQAIFIFSGQYRQEFLLRRQQAHLERLKQLGEQALSSDPQMAQALQASRLTGNQDQVMARVAMQLAQREAQDYYTRLVSLMKEDGESPKVVHLQAIRREAEMARAQRVDPNDVWGWYKQAQADGQLIIVDDELEPWLGDLEQEPRPPLGPEPRRFIPKN
jgi:hypothetical protein